MLIRWNIIFALDTQVYASININAIVQNIHPRSNYLGNYYSSWKDPARKDFLFFFRKSLKQALMKKRRRQRWHIKARLFCLIFVNASITAQPWQVGVSRGCSFVEFVQRYQSFWPGMLLLTRLVRRCRIFMNRNNEKSEESTSTSRFQLNCLLYWCFFASKHFNMLPAHIHSVVGMPICF